MLLLGSAQRARTSRGMMACAILAGALLLTGVGAEVDAQVHAPVEGLLAEQIPAPPKAFGDSAAVVPEVVELPVVRVSHTTAGQEVKKKAEGAMVGAVLIFLAFPILWFNERRQAKMWALFGRAKSIVKVNVSSDKVDPSNEARLVHAKGSTANEKELRDAQFGVSVENCAALRREVEMFQWVESEQKEEKDDNYGGKTTITTYSYTQEWRSDAQDSTGFQEMGHDNPPMPCEGQTFRAEAVSFGAFNLSKTLIEKMCNFTQLTQKELPGQISLSGRGSVVLQGSQYSTVAPGMAPQIGDVRISFEKVPCGDATILAVQHNDSFAPLRADMTIKGGKVVRPEGGNAALLDHSNTSEMLDQAEKQENIDLDMDGGCGACCALVGTLVESGEEIYMIAESEQSAAQMFKTAQNQQALIHTVLQLVGFLFLLIGWDAILSLLPSVFRFIPFIGIYIQYFGNFLASIVSFVLAVFFWCITVALAWLAARPMKAGLLLGVAALLFLVPWYISQQPNQPHYG